MVRHFAGELGYDFFPCKNVIFDVNKYQISHFKLFTIFIHIETVSNIIYFDE
jgi:hypothetical protein